MVNRDKVIETFDLVFDRELKCELTTSELSREEDARAIVLKLLGSPEFFQLNHGRIIEALEAKS